MAPQRSPASDGGTGTERQLWPSCYEKSPETHTQECWNLWLRLGPCCQTWGWGQAQEEGIDHTWVSEVQHEALWNFYPLPA